MRQIYTHFVTDKYQCSSCRKEHLAPWMTASVFLSIALVGCIGEPLSRQQFLLLPQFSEVRMMPVAVGRTDSLFSSSIFYVDVISCATLHRYKESRHIVQRYPRTPPPWRPPPLAHMPSLTGAPAVYLNPPPHRSGPTISSL